MLMDKMSSSRVKPLSDNREQGTGFREEGPENVSPHDARLVIPLINCSALIIMDRMYVNGSLFPAPPTLSVLESFLLFDGFECHERYAPFLLTL